MTDIYMNDCQVFFTVTQDTNKVYAMISDSFTSEDAFICFTGADDGELIYIRKKQISAFSRSAQTI